MSKVIALVLILGLLVGCSNKSPAPSGDDSWLNNWDQNQQQQEPQQSAPQFVPPVEPDAPIDLGPPRTFESSTTQTKPETKKPEVIAEATTADVPANWTGAVIYHAAWCQNCPTLINDIQDKADGWKIGYGNDVHFKLVDFDKRPANFPKIDRLPTVVYFKNGQEVDRVVGYGGTQDEFTNILSRHPKVNKASLKIGLAQTYQASPVMVYESPVLVSPTYVMPAMAPPMGMGLGINFGIGGHGVCIGGHCR